MLSRALVVFKRAQNHQKVKHLNYADDLNNDDTRYVTTRDLLFDEMLGSPLSAFLRPGALIIDYSVPL